MRNINNGGSEFPSHEAAESDYRNQISGGGMSLRDYFAAKAMQGMMVGLGGECYGDRAEKSLSVEEWQEWCATAIAKQSYRIADAMLRVREK